MLSIDIFEAIGIVSLVKGYLTNTVLLTSVCRQACCHFEHPSRVPKVPLSRLPKKAPCDSDCRQSSPHIQQAGMISQGKVRLDGMLHPWRVVSKPSGR